MSAKIFHYFLVFIAAITLNSSVDISDYLLYKNESAHDNSVKKTFLQKDIAVFASTHTPPCQFIKVHIPFESAPAPTDRDIPNENEPEDDFEHDSSPMAEQQTLFFISDFVTVHNWVTQSSSLIQNRITVPLFVLYHSWKSFMS